MHNPLSTYRIQFHKDFRLNDLEQIIPYLKQLGIKAIYASPIFEAVPGSRHGYDTINPHRINPEIGTEQELFQLSKKLKAAGMNWIQDIVPNHMAFHPANPWLTDVLEKGSSSDYTSFFDIRFPSGIADERIMVPFLGTSIEAAIESGELKLIDKEGNLFLSYGGSNWPLNEASLLLIQDLEHPGSKASNTARTAPKLTGKTAKATIKKVNNSPELLQKIADAQYYRLCHWQETDQQINFRRFFTVNGLICLNIQEKEVFAVYHQYIAFLVEKGIFQGLRVDHIDGLYDPEAYLRRLRELAGDQTYIVVEKILEKDEQLPVDWDIQGSTGYDFLALVNNLFTDQTAENTLTKLYEKVTGEAVKMEEEVPLKKSAILFHHMQGELDHLYRLFLSLNLISNTKLKRLKRGTLKQAIGEFLVHCPVYRFYESSFPLAEQEQQTLKEILKMVEENKALKPAVKILNSVLLKKPVEKSAGYKDRVLSFYQRCMQFSGPLMAKGVEDTLMYTYNRFAGHNEVGDSQDSFGISITDFHHKMAERQKNWPLALNSTATHDTKRGEDVRARLNVLTDIPDLWEAVVQKLEKLPIAERPDANDRYLIYQTVLGALPMPGEPDDDTLNRLQQYLEKALREAKANSDWAEPNEDYESVAKRFTTSLLRKNSEGLKILQDFLGEIADFGIVNALAQLILKHTCPGVPDTYQGTELWDLSLVDPDNRRPVDYEQRMELLAGSGKTKDLNELWKERYSGRLKQAFSKRLLELRNSLPALFESGTYLPLKVKGAYREHILAFARPHGNTWLVVVIPVGLASIHTRKAPYFEETDWKNTRIHLPDDVPSSWMNVFNNQSGIVQSKTILVKAVFNQIPLAVLKLKEAENKRGAGILMHISSLPSAFGIGDIGPEARKFITFLKHSRQRYWQLLPLNPTGAAQFYSPYSANSAIAGNVLFISPELLKDAALLDHKDLEKFKLPVKGTVNFKKVIHHKMELLNRAYHCFKRSVPGKLHQQYADFLHAEADWLGNFAIYTVAKLNYKDAPWYEWPDDLKFRDQNALKQFSSQFIAEIDEVKWQQFIFFGQWKALKAYANLKGISFIGDLPFYTGYDSVDVWAKPSIFKLDKQLNISGMAGVPPDYFNADGQLWGMPVFRWDILKKQNYSWWINRIRKNMELYDLLRLDHFRAFSAYWEVPADAASAIEGKWMPGPGKAFFQKIRETFKQLPFIAEDLGEIDMAVYQLRDEFELPGMKVLHFGFGDDMPASAHLPHNYTSDNFIVYTGTHDNNTTKGWYREDLSRKQKKGLSSYTVHEVNESNAHQILVVEAYASIARIAILPIQDVLGLNEKARINTPASVKRNWIWRLKKHQLNNKLSKWLSEKTSIYGRA